MATTPYLFVNIVALCAYVILFAAFTSAKKTLGIRSFTAALAGFILWTGGSVLMRLQFFPGKSFWFYVSLLALFSVALSMYYFACGYTGRRGGALGVLWAVGTVIISAAALSGLFIAPPAAVVQPGGETIFVYQVTWRLAIPCLYFFIVLLSASQIILSPAKDEGDKSGLFFIAFGIIAVFMGNLVQMVPGNIFPTDVLGGIIFAACLTYALVQQRVFALEYLVAPNVCLLVAVAVFLAGTLPLVPRLEKAIMQTMSLPRSTVTVAIVIIEVVLSGIALLLFQELFRRIFRREKRLNKLLGDFSRMVSQTLSTAEILQRLADTVEAGVQVQVSNLLVYRDSKLAGFDDSPGSIIEISSGMSVSIETAKQLFAGKPYAFSEELQELAESADWANAGAQLVVPLKKDRDILGFMLLPGKESQRQYNMAELDFLVAAVNIAAIAMSNAALYEEVCQEARIDHLTGLYNYSYFVGKTEEMVNLAPEDPLALVYLDVDDMKLYNQLYGAIHGDKILKRTAGLARALAGENGVAFRHSGKVFAVLLPGYSADNVQDLVEKVRDYTKDFAVRDRDKKHKPVTISSGICTYPDVARNARELIDFADLAVFNAKNTGKGKNVVIRSSDPGTIKAGDQALLIINQIERRGSDSFASYLATIRALTAAIDAKDHYTYNHSQNVAYYAAVLAVAIGLSDSQVRLIYEAGLLHDTGKISIAESILSKNDDLTEDERLLMNKHVDNSIEIIRHLPSMDYIIPVVVAHHERWDGQGYPRGLAGEKIPKGARCLAVADSFDAMTSDRPYRKARSLAYALAQLEENSGTQFDPAIARRFAQLVRDNEISVTPDGKVSSYAIRLRER